MALLDVGVNCGTGYVAQITSSAIPPGAEFNCAADLSIGCCTDNQARRTRQRQQTPRWSTDPRSAECLQREILRPSGTAEILAITDPCRHRCWTKKDSSAPAARQGAQKAILTYTVG